MGILRKIALVYMVILLSAASLNYIPGLTDSQGRAFGVFALDIFDDALHVASALWAGIAAFTSNRAARIFLRYFGLLYLTDGLLGLATGSGYLDLGIINYGVLDYAADVQDSRQSAAHRRWSVRGLLERATSALRSDDPPALAAPAKSGQTAETLQVGAGQPARSPCCCCCRRWRMSNWACRGEAATQTYQPLITDPAFQRREANTYLTYPEWHIVFAYDGLAQALKTGDEHAFDYLTASRISGAPPARSRASRASTAARTGTRGA